jgi:hypothetical protein
MRTNHPYLDRFRRQFGRTRKIERIQVMGLIAEMAKHDGLDLRGYAGWYGVRETEDLTTIAAAVANAIQGITMVSLGGQVRDIQYDQPGSMHPSQYAQISFVSEELAHDDYLRRHAARLIVVTGERIPLACDPQPEPQTYTVTCDNGHKWEIPRADHPEELDRCPNCGEYWQ